MATCEYCGAAFDDEASLVGHLAAEHRGELGPIDQRRVASYEDDGDRELPTGPIVLGSVIVGSVLLVAFVTLGMGGGGGGATINGIDIAQTPGELRSDHGHGTINVTIAGQRIDFSQPRYQAPSGEFAGQKFHFERGNGRIWHTHADGVTLEYAMATLGIAVSESSVAYDGTTYTDGENAAVVVTVNGEPVDPSAYVLEGVGDPAAATQGDHIRIVVRTDG